MSPQASDETEEEGKAKRVEEIFAENMSFNGEIAALKIGVEA